MAQSVHVGVLALQGAFLEHIQLFRAAATAAAASSTHATTANGVTGPDSIASSGGENTSSNGNGKGNSNECNGEYAKTANASHSSNTSTRGIGHITWTFAEVRTVAELDRCDALVIPGGESTTMALVAQRSGLLEPLRNFVKVKRRPTWGTCAGLILLAESANRTKQGGQDLIGGLDVRVNRNHFGRQSESFETGLNLPFLASTSSQQQQMAAAAGINSTSESSDSSGPSGLTPYNSPTPFRAIFIRAPIVEKLLPSVDGEQLSEAARSDTVTAPSSRDIADAGATAAATAVSQSLTTSGMQTAPVEVLATLPGRHKRLIEMDVVVPVAPASGDESTLASTSASAPAPAGDIVAVRQGNVFACSFHPELTADSRIHAWWLQQVITAVDARTA